MNKVDWTKPIQTRDGRKARLLGILDPVDKTTSHVVAITRSDGYEVEYAFRPTGNYSTGVETALDIINVPERVLRWVNVYEDDRFTHCWGSRAKADEAHHEQRAGLVKLTIEDGKLVSSEVVE